METGEIKWFDGVQGFGFIDVEDERKDVFVHQSAINRRDSLYTTLCEGDKVKFERVKGKKGPKAKNVLIYEPAV